ncbi:hypothetical protein ACTMO5_15010, partial [Enterococcus faecium]|uniref:hypothetical protein n=1 Tax=Enterococcus faecium TaxID=1352 RepID=UPI003F894D9E
MRMIEAEIHEILLDIVHDAHDYEEQAQIVATATSIFENSRDHLSEKQIKQASSNDKLREAMMIDSLFQAMGHLSEWHKTASRDIDDEDYTPSYIDGRGLTPEQITRAASKGVGFGSMDILNDSELDEFFGAPEGIEVDQYF